MSRPPNARIFHSIEVYVAIYKSVHLLRPQFPKLSAEEEQHQQRVIFQKLPRTL